MRRNRRGQALVELAVALPVLLLVLMGIIDFGRVFHSHLTVTTAARAGARVAIVGAADAEIQEAVRQAAATLDAAALNVEISPGSAERGAGVNVTVQVEYELPIITPIISRLLPNPYTVVGKAVMRGE